MLNVNPVINPAIPTNAVNFKAGENTKTVNKTKPAMNDEVILQKMLAEQKKQEKSRKVKNNIITGVSIASGLAIIAMVIMQFKAMKGGGKEQMKELGLLLEKDFQTMMKDCSKEKSFEKLHLSDSLTQKLKEIEDKIARSDVYKNLNLPESTKAMLLFGLPGTGKNTFTYALTKKFPNAELFCPDMTKVLGPYMGIPEKNLRGATDFALKKAEELKASKKKLIVFFDEIDRVMMQDKSSNAKHSNDILTEFKQCFNDLKAQDNIIIIGATNKEIDAKLAQRLGTGVIDDAMANRFGDKIRVELPTSKAISAFINDQFKGIAAVDDILKTNNPKLTKFCDILHDNESHKFSFRTLQDVIEKIQPTKEGKLTLNEVIDATINSKETIFLTVDEIKMLENLKNTI